MSDRLTTPGVMTTRAPKRDRFSVAAPATFNWPPAISRAVHQHSGARYFRCALQVNTPFQSRFKGFDSKHPRHSTAYKRDYGLALAQQCKKFGIDVVGICDHNSVEYVQAVRNELTQEGIQVFPGFEVASTEGLHILCLFDPSSSTEEIDHIITELQLPPKDRWVSNSGVVPKQSPLSFPQILELVQRERRGICIAAHIDRENGLLFECAKTTRVQYFTDGNLLAGQISGSPAELMPFHRKVVLGELNHYRRKNPLALLNCLDVYQLKDLAHPAASSLIKMSSPAIDGLWQAFLDPDSRLRLLTEETPRAPRRSRMQDKVELIAVSWEGEESFLDNCGIHFNENLNCLIGGRGTGKSSIIESLRGVLGQAPLGEQARQSHESIMKQVVKEHTKITLLVRTHQPAPSYYLIERRYPEEPVVFDENGGRTELKVFDILPSLDIFGQHEISEIARHPEKQLDLLKRFRPAGAEKFEVEKHECLHLLARNRADILRARHELEKNAEKLGRLPGLEEKLRRYEAQGIEARLHEQSLLAREELFLRASRDRIAALKKLTEQFKQKLEADERVFEARSSERLPNADLLTKIAEEHERLSQVLRQSLSDLDEVLEHSRRKLEGVAAEWERRRRDRQQDYQKILRQLQKEAIDGEAYVRLRRDLEELAPMRSLHEQQTQKLRELEKRRKRLLQRLEAAGKKLHRLDHLAAKHVTALLQDKVRVAVWPSDKREAMIEKLRRLKKGLHKELYRSVRALENFVLPEFVACVRAGKEALKAKYSFTPKQAEVLAELEERIVLELEEAPPQTEINIEHNVATSELPPVWKKLTEVSTGQRATAILLMLLPENHTPLLIDQPEDDLDNRFIAEQIIPKLREEKTRRQFIFATHNANLPVLGDAELIVALEAKGDSQAGHAQILESNMGSIDRETVKLCVEHVLEGGKQAFEQRRAKYGF